jgi:hypothetical protein
MWFGTSFYDEVPEGLVLERFTRRARAVQAEGHEKCIVQPAQVEIFSVHMVVKGLPTLPLSPETLRFNHYYSTGAKRRHNHALHNEVEDSGDARFLSALRARLAQNA